MLGQNKTPEVTLLCTKNKVQTLSLLWPSLLGWLTSTLPAHTSSLAWLFL